MQFDFLAARLFFVSKLVVILLLVVQGSEAFLPMLLPWPELSNVSLALSLLSSLSLRSINKTIISPVKSIRQSYNLYCILKKYIFVELLSHSHVKNRKLVCVTMHS